jgi:hypothetical protein
VLSAILGQDDVAFLLKKQACEIDGLGYAETDDWWRRGCRAGGDASLWKRTGTKRDTWPLIYKGPCPCPVFAAGSFLFVPFMSRLSRWVDGPLAAFRFP